jgi:hypothetical protein
LPAATLTGYSIPAFRRRLKKNVQQPDQRRINAFQSPEEERKVNIKRRPAQTLIRELIGFPKKPSGFKIKGWRDSKAGDPSFYSPQGRMD